MKTLAAAITSLFFLSDEEAMGRVQQHDDAHAFAFLVRRWEAPIQRLCTRMLGDGHRGEDLTQDTFARLFAKRKDYQPRGKFSTFLWRIAINLCYDELRRLKRRPESPLDEAEMGDMDNVPSLAALPMPPDAMLLRREASDLVQHAVLQLSDTYRGVVVLRHYENLKFRQIAEVLGVPEGTIKSRVYYGLRALRNALEEMGYDG